MDKEGVVCVYTDYDSAIKGHEVLAFVTTWMEQGGIMLSETGQRDKYYVMSLIWGL